MKRKARKRFSTQSVASMTKGEEERENEESLSDVCNKNMKQRDPLFLTQE